MNELEAVAEGTTTLLRAIRDHPEDAALWGRLEVRYRPYLLVWCRRQAIQGSDADDLTQEILTKLLSILVRFQYDPSRGTFRGFLASIAEWTWIDLCKKRRRQLPVDATARDAVWLDAVEARDDFLAMLHERFDLHIFEEAKRMAREASPEKEWRAWCACKLEEVSAPKIAAELGIKAGSVYEYCSRVEERIRGAVRRLEGRVAQRGA